MAKVVLPLQDAKASCAHTLFDGRFSINDLVEGLVREYLTRNALSSTLQGFDRERPRGPHSVSSRSALRKSLGLERLPVKVNKQQSTSTLELWVLYQQLKLTSAADAADSDAQQLGDGIRSSQGAKARVHHEPETSQAQLHVQAPGASTQPASCLPALQPPAPTAAVGTSTQGHAGHQPRHAQHHTRQLRASTHLATAVTQPLQQQGDLTLQDVEDDVDHHGPMQASSTQEPQAHSSTASQPQVCLPHHSLRTVKHSEMNDMRQLLFGEAGRASQLPWLAWKQGFYFSSRPGLSFGLVQQQGGPCGLLAAVQAHVMAAIMNQELIGSLDITAEQQASVLVTALASAVWQVSDGHAAQLVCCSQPSTAALSFDQLCNSATQLSCTSRLALEAASRQQLRQFQEPSGYGLILLLFSLLLTHGVRQTRQDMDEPQTCLIAQHGYCSQDLVNLVLTGHATTNCFNGEQDVAGQQCRGVAQPAQLGFLSLFEWYGYMQVGSHLKDPAVHVWVVCSESHFSVLYALDEQQSQRAGKSCRGLPRLMYYDPLANQEQPIILSLSSNDLPEAPWLLQDVIDHDSVRLLQQGNTTLVSPLEHVIHTKWPKVSVHWTGSDPIL
ncbi:hypothetical protein ABBQ32_009658 [Trebouxia sp. C0010 RCD-2024]